MKVHVQSKTDDMLGWGPLREGENPSGRGNPGKAPGEGGYRPRGLERFQQEQRGTGRASFVEET